MKMNLARGVRLALVLCLPLVSACEHDIVEIENLNYATAIGVDYKDDQYYVYIQTLGLSSLAKSEGDQKTPPEAYVSETSGKSFVDAFFKAYYTAQEKILWAHVTSIVFSEAALEKGLGGVFDGLTRYYEFRPTPWIFGTKDSIRDILSTHGFFSQNSIKTILHNPNSTYEQSSTIRPIRLNQFAREFFDPGCTTYIPSLTINKKQWKKNNKKEEKVEIDGAFFLHGQEYKRYFPFKKIKGLRWVFPETVRASILIPYDENPEFIAVLKSQRVRIRSERHGDEIRFTLIYSAKGNVANRMKNTVGSVFEMEKLVSEWVIAEVRQLYELGVEYDIDFLNLEHELYRKYNRQWKEMIAKGHESFLRDNRLKSIQANINLEHSGSSNNRKITIQE